MDRRRTVVLAWSLLGVTILLALVGLILFVLTWGAPQPTGGFGTRGVSLLVGVATAAIGTLVALRLPANPIGWLLLFGGAAGFCLYELPILYAMYALFVRHGEVPGGVISAWLTAWIWGSALVFLGLMFLVFPDGRFLSKRWRLVAIVLVLSWVVAGVFVALTPGAIDTFREVDNPFGVAWAQPTADIAILVAFAALAASAVSLVPRYRAAGSRERNQIRWVMAAGVFVAVAYIAYLPIGEIFGGHGPDPPIVNLAETVVYLSIASVPVAVGIAILKHRLFDIDVVINKAVVFGLLAAFITVVYVAVVVGIGALIGSTGESWLSAVAAASVALAFQPVRRWAQGAANRLVYGKRATPYEVLHDFSQRVASSYGTEDVLPRMATILGEGTGARRAQVWLRVGGELRPTAVWPDGAERSRPIASPTQDLPEIADVSRAVPVRDGRELLGVLSVTKVASEPITPTEEKLVDDLALQAGLVLRNVRLVEDVRASRGRLVAAQDQERRRIERDIHDGAQQQLVALAVKARLAESMVGKDEARERTLLQEIGRDTQGSLESLRDLARGIYPPLLADKGLPAALEAQSRKSALPVVVRADGTGRYSVEIEATVYFCVLEALQNAAKYSGAAGVNVTLHVLDGELGFEVTDEGRGFDPVITPRGSGLQNMSDRLEAVGGRLEIVSSTGEGTRVRGRIPIPIEVET